MTARVVAFARGQRVRNMAKLIEGAVMIREDADFTMVQYGTIVGLAWHRKLSVVAIQDVERGILQILRNGMDRKYTVFCAMNNAAAAYPGAEALRCNQQMLKRYDASLRGLIALFLTDSSVVRGTWRLVNLAVGTDKFQMTGELKAAAAYLVNWEQQLNMLDAMKFINFLAASAPARAPS